MPSKKAHETKRKRGKDKQRRNFELNGKYSAKHLRQREAQLANSQAQKTTPPPDPTK